MLTTMIGRILTVERHSYRRARLRGRAWLAKQGRLAVLVLAAVSAPGIAGVDVAARAAEFGRVAIAYLRQAVERPPKLSNLDVAPENEGFAGGRLSIKDNDTTGRFLKQEFVLREVEKYPLVGQRVWQIALTPDEKLLFTTNGVSNDVSVIDVERLKVIKSIPVGRFPWGVVVAKD